MNGVSAMNGEDRCGQKIRYGENTRYCETGDKSFGIAEMKGIDRVKRWSVSCSESSASYVGSGSLDRVER